VKVQDGLSVGACAPQEIRHAKDMNYDITGISASADVFRLVVAKVWIWKTNS
jgi:hypothetical protein